MFFNYESFCNKVKSLSKNKYSNIVYGITTNKNLEALTIYFIINLLSSYIFNIYIYLVIFIISFIILLIWFNNRRIGIAINEDKILYAELNKFPFIQKNIYEIDLNIIKYLNYKKIGGLNIVNLSFINEEGKLIRLKFKYNDFVIGLSIKKQKENAIIISNKIKEVEKILDRGDF